MTASARSAARLAATLGGAAILAAWLGAAIYFAAVVAPAAFRALPARSLAGALVGATLPTLFVSGIVAGCAAAIIAWRAGGTASGTRVGGPVAMAALCVAGRFVIGPRIDRLRSALGATLELLPLGDPSRVAFGRLHALSVLALATAMLGALAGLFGAWTALRTVPAPPAG